MSALLSLAGSVALAPRSSGAQAAVEAGGTLRHTLTGRVGAVTQVALGDIVQPNPRTARADVRVAANVRVELLLEPPKGSSPVTGWEVRDADGRWVAWPRAVPVVVASRQPTGKRTVTVAMRWRGAGNVPPPLPPVRFTVLPSDGVTFGADGVPVARFAPR